jgi:chemotaxis protein CheX
MSVSATARSPSHTVTLPAALDLDVAATLSRTLNNCRGEDVVIDASYVQRFGAQCFEVLHAAQQTWKADNRLFLVNGPASFVEQLSGAGLAFV